MALKNPIKFSPDEIEEAKKAVTISFSPDEIEEAQAKVPTPKPEPSGLEKTETFLRSGVSGLTAGLSEPVVSGLSALISKGVEKLPIGPSDEEMIAAGLNPRAEPTLEELYKADVEQRKALKEQLPGYDVSGEVLGSLSPVGPAAAAFKGIQGAVKAIPGVAKLGMAAPVVEGALTSGGYAGSQALARKAALEPTGFVEPGEEEGALEQAKTGALLGAAIPGAGAILKGAAKGAKMGLVAGLGLKPKTIERFLERPESVMNAKSNAEIVEKAKETVERIKKEAVNAKRDLTDDISTGLGVLKQRIIEASDEAYKVLEANPKKVSKDTVLNAIKSAKSSLEQPGMVGEAVNTAKSKINNFINDLQGLEDEIDGVTLKRIVKSLDNEIDNFGPMGAFASTTSEGAMKQARGNVDKLLKSEFKGYEEAIAPVRNLAQFHTEVFKDFSKPEKVFSSLSRFGKPGQEIKDERLKRLFKETNVDPDRFRKAQEDAEFFKNWSDHASVEKKAIGMMNEKSEALRQQWQKLSELSTDDFIRQLEDLSTKTQFEQEFLRGSRNVNFWTAIGGGAGSILGGGIPGAIMGAAMGATVDKYGPKMGQQVLASYAKVRGLPTVQKVKQAFDSVPDSIKKDAVDGFVRAMTTANRETEPTFIPSQYRQEVFNTIKFSPGLSPLEKAKMQTSLMRDGTVPNFNKVIFSGDKAPQRIPLNMEQSGKKPQPPSLENVTDFIKAKRESAI